jgi:3-hydroxybutyryl-CoA dehydrogenase
MIHTICICGAGTMGSGIAQAAAQSGLTTLLYDIDERRLGNAKIEIEKNVHNLETKNKISAAGAGDTISHIHYVHEMKDCVADIVLEAIAEDLGSKTELFDKLAGVNSDGTVLASNTSSLSITKIAERTPHPERVIGMHFFNPPTAMKLVEVVHTEFTNVRTRDSVIELALQMGKEPVICRDAPGFIVNRVARPFYIEALRILEQQEGHMEIIDELMEASGFKMGPFKLMDLIGNDINYSVSCSVYEALGKPERLRPSVIQQEKVLSGELGRKSGKGYYSYR